MKKSVKRTIVAILAAAMLTFGATSAFAGIESEPANNTNAGADILTVGDVGGGFIIEGDLDYWNFTAPTTRTYDLLAINQGRIGGYDLYLWDTTNGYILVNTTLGPIDSMNTNVNLLAGHTYIIFIATNDVVKSFYNIRLN